METCGFCPAAGFLLCRTGGHTRGGAGLRGARRAAVGGICLACAVGGLAKRFFRNRREGIKNELDGLEARRAAAREKLAAVEQRIANLDAEREAILAESRAQAEALRQGIVEEARRQAAQIVEQARLTAENEGRAVFAEVRAAIADEIVDATEKILRAKLDAGDHEKLIANSLTKVVLH